MVAVAWSTGCHLCVKRRVKCDETRPGCARCAKYGAACPGYDRELKFVTYKQTAARSRKRKPSPGRSAAGQCSNPETHTVPDDGVLRQEELGSESGAQLLRTAASTDPDTWECADAVTQRTTRLYLYPSNNRAQLICNMIQTLSQTEKTNSEVMVFAPWFNHVPQHLGKKPALDSAMAAFTMHLLGKAENDERLVGESRSVYGQSLSALQRALNHAAEWKSSETLCATMILTLFELFAGTSDPSRGTADPRSWMKHASGVSWLLQQRGPDAHREPWDRSMLLSFRTPIIMNSMFSGSDCFLAKRKWQLVLVDLAAEEEEEAGSSAVASANNLQPVVDQYFACLARVPGILRHGYTLREARRHGMPIDLAQVAMLVRHTEKLHQDFTAWFVRFRSRIPQPVEVPRPADSTDPLVDRGALSYANIWHGAMYVSYWATMLILQETLNNCQYPVDYGDSNRQMANDIFRSVETVGKGYMGPYRIGYAVRIAYEFADVSTQLWLMSVLAGTEKHYAATSPVSYPAPGTTQ
ncbi:hypothetical protein QBC46DRAFT_378732 [Diplogelasinospora grovesii]|uniref:Zn(2)-C6 fungal-type domain-containing protein n=1 Tax=Diplogelasinospora grovesii TaxID=303347 RepID=A0AAN6NDX0_9PEZI|nr:hypothetical protein QBC46DRAFT_378732 [Diplogelasinospora grovesii]